MKNSQIFLVLASLAVSFSSCESIRNLFDVEIDTTIEGDLSFVTDDTKLKSTDDVGFTASNTVRVLNDDLYEYEENIKEFNTMDISVEVIAVDSSDVILRSGTSFTIENMNSGYVWTLTSDWPIEPGFVLNMDVASYDAINDILDDRIDFTISTQGTCNKPNVHITLRYGIHTTVVATPLE